MASHRWAAALVAGISVHWIPFHSHIYHFTISQPTTYNHVVLRDVAHRRVDYFFPRLGDSVTNVNVYRDGKGAKAASYLRSMGAHNVHRDGIIRIMGRKHPLISANFVGMSEHFTVEQVILRDRGQVWHLTISFADRFRSQRKIMLRMLRSFHVG